jgi:hypothetical protein
MQLHHHPPLGVRTETIVDDNFQLFKKNLKNLLLPVQNPRVAQSKRHSAAVARTLSAFSKAD